MKKLIIVKEIGKQNTKKTDEEIKKIVIKNKKDELFIYCNEFVLNRTGEYIRKKGVKILSVQTAQPGQTFTEEFKEIIEIDEWAKGKGEMFNKEKNKEKKDDDRKNNKQNKNRKDKKDK